MLETLDTISWQNLTHAYGPAYDVPDLIRALASADQSARHKAELRLYGNLWHQGAVFEATAYAVPFLLELLNEPGDQDKPWILNYLAQLATGQSYTDAQDNLDFLRDDSDQHRQAGQLQREFEEETAWVSSAHKAVLRGIPWFMSLLKDPSEATAVAAAFLLGSVRANRAEIVGALELRFHAETRPAVRVSLLLAIGSSIAASDRAAQICEQAVADAESELERAAAAMALVRLRGDKAPDAALEQLFEQIDPADELEELYGSLPWNENGLCGDICTCISLTGFGARKALPLMIRALTQTTSPDNALSLLRILLRLVFPAPSDAAQPFDRLSTDQQAVMTALTQNDSAWTYRSSAAELLSTFGLPDSQDRVRAYVGLPPLWDAAEENSNWVEQIRCQIKPE